jgi:hypothetical protein
VQALDDIQVEEKQFRSRVFEAEESFNGNPLLNVREWLSAENVALFVVCMADMFSTLYWVHAGMATEDNPVFREWLRRGDGQFIFMKFASFMPLIAVSTYYRRRRPKLIKSAMRLTVGAYIFLYVARFAAQFIGM